MNRGPLAQTVEDLHISVGVACQRLSQGTINVLNGRMPHLIEACIFVQEKSYTFTLGNSKPSLGEFAGSKSALLRGISIAFLSLIGTQKVPGSPQFVFRRTSRSPYRFSSRWRDLTMGPSKIQSSSRALSLPLYLSPSNHFSPNHPFLISCSSAAPVGLSSLVLLFFCRPCRSRLPCSLVLLPPLSVSAPLFSCSSAAPVGLSPFYL
ncbi:uncharacterized protein TNCV_4334841 [Trichonephila clavipes]|nr:uncharacterized protein TNCV_4334841 [Trichonephila clavipes]